MNEIKVSSEAIVNQLLNHIGQLHLRIAVLETQLNETYHSHIKVEEEK